MASTALVGLILVAGMEGSLANPTGGAVVAGSATISQPSSTVTEITQQSNRAIIDWTSFSIGQGERTQFYQPNSSAFALNRVTGGDPSVIAGHLIANGNIAIVNRSGILFAKGSEVDVNSLIATTADIHNQDFMAGKFNFNIPSPNPNATVINAGQISVGDHGLAALVGPGVANSGVIQAKLGTVVLGGAQTFTVDFYGDGLISFAVGSQVTQAPLGPDGKPLPLVSNTGQISADGGSILLTADAVDNIVTNMVEAGGTLQAQTIGASTGSILIDGGPSAGGTVLATGTIDATGRDPGATGGSVAVLGDRVGVMAGASIDASGDAGGGTVLIGGNFHGAGPQQNASVTVVQRGATIKADAITLGDGGKIAVWSNSATGVYGSISARGGALGGNGGMIETSSHGYLDTAGVQIDTSALRGTAGLWLLDPDTLTITNATSANDPNAGTFTQPFASNDGNPSTLNVTDLQNALTNGNVLVQTTTGDIDVAATFANTTTNNLGLNSGGSIVIGNNTAAVNIDFSGSKSGSLFMNAAGSIGNTGNGGTIIMGGGSLQLAAGTGIGTGAGGPLVTTGVTALAATTTAGAIALTNSGSDVTVTQIAVGNDGNVTNGKAGAPFNTVTGLTAGTGITLQNTGNITLSQAVSTPAGPINIQATGNLTVSAAVGGSGVTAATTGTIDLGAGATTGTLTIAGGVGSLSADTVTLTGQTININQQVASHTSVKATGQTIDVKAGVVGDTGGVAVKAVTPAHTGNVTIEAAGFVASSSGPILLQSDGDVNVGGAIGAAGGGAGVATGTITLTADSAQTGTAGTLTITGGVGSNQAGPISLSGWQISLGAAVDGGGSLTIAPSTTASSIGIGDGAAGTFSLTNASLQNIGSSGKLNTIGTDLASITIGSANGTGAVTVDSTTKAGTTPTLGFASSLTIESGGTKGTIAINSPLSVSQTLTLQAGSTITEAAGATIAAAKLTGSAGGAVSLGNTTNTVAQLSDFTTGNNNFTLGDQASLTITGNVNAGTGTVEFDVVGAASAINEGPNGTITAGTLQGGSGAGTTLNGVNHVANLGGFTTGGDLSFADAQTLNGTGTWAAGANLLVTTTGAGSDLNVGNASAVGGLVLTSANNLALNGLVTAGGDSALIWNGPTLTVPGILNFGAHNILLGWTGLSVAPSAATLANITAGGLVVDLTNATGNLALTGNFAHIGAIMTGAVNDGFSYTYTGVGSLAVGVDLALPPASTLSGAYGISAPGDVAVNAALGDINVVHAISGANVGVTAGGNIGLGANLNATNTATLSAGAAITQTGGIVTAATLTGNAGGPVTLASTGNQIGNLGGFTTANNSFTLADQSALTITGAVNAGVGIVELDATGGAGITESTGTIVANTLNGSTVGGTASFGDAGNSIVNLGNFTTGGGSFTLVDGLVLAVTGAVNTGNGALSLTVPGSVILPGLTITGTLNSGNGTTTIAAPTGTAIVAGATDLNAPLGSLLVSDASLGQITAGGGVNLTTSGAADIFGNGVSAHAGYNTLTLNSGRNVFLDGTMSVGAGTLKLNAAGVITQNGGTITAGSLTGSSTGAVTLAAGNAIGGLGDFATGNGNFQLGDLTSLTITGNVNAGTGTVELDVTGAASAINEGPNGTIAAGMLQGSSGAGTTLNGVNHIVDLGNFNTGGDLKVTDAQGLNLVGIANGANVALTTTTGDLTLGGDVFGGTVTLQSGGAINQISGFVSATTLIGQANTALTMNGGNEVTTLGPLTAGGNISFGDLFSFNTNGAITGANVTLASAGNIGLGGNVQGATVQLQATGGALTQNSGIITAVTLIGTAGADATMNDGNQVTNLGPFNAGGNLSFVNAQALGSSGAWTAGGTLTVTTTGANSNLAAGVASGVNVTLTAGADLTLSQNVTATNVATLNAAGVINQNGGIIAANTLTGTTGGAAGMNDANQVTNFGAFTAGGNLSFNDAFSINTIGAITGANVTLTTPGNVALNGNVQGGVVTLTAGGAISQNAGVITAGTLTGSAGAAATMTEANQVAHLGPFGAGGNLFFLDAVSLNSSGAWTAGGELIVEASGAGSNLGVGTASGTNVALVAGGNLSLNQNVTATSLLLLEAGGSINQTGGVISASTLEGIASAGATMNGSNHVANFGPFTAGGSLSFADSMSFSVTGAVTAAGNLFLAGGGGITLDTNMTAGNVMTVDAMGGALTTPASLTLTAGSLVQLGGTSFVISSGVLTVKAPALQIVARPTGVAPSDFVQAQGVVTATADQMRSLDQILPPGFGVVNLGNSLSATGSQVLISVGTGTITGHLDVGALAIDGSSANLTGTIAGQGGPAAAGLGSHSPNPNNADQFNNCAIGTVNCIVLPQVVPFIVTPIDVIDLLEAQPPSDPIDIDRLNTGSEDSL